MYQSLTSFIRTSNDKFSARKYSGRQKRVIPFKYQLFGMGLNMASHFRNQWAAKVVSDLWFTVFKGERKPWVSKFWQAADEWFDIEVGEHRVPVYTWGQGPLVVTMHGWSGSGTQFRRFITPLVEAGYRVAAFDAPAHGNNPGNQTHLLDFADSLIAIQSQLGKIDTVIAHSLGGMAAVWATHRGLVPAKMVLLGPHMDVQKMFESYSELLNLNSRISKQFHENLGRKMAEILEVDDPWELLSTAKLLANCDYYGLVIFDRDDEEIPQSIFQSILTHCSDCEVLQTEGLGHQKILKDNSVIERVTGFIQRAA